MTITLGLPQGIYLLLTVIGLLCVAACHGKSREDYNFWTYLGSTIAGLALLYWGGWFH